MGEREVLNIPRTGDVVLIASSEGVFMRDDLHTSLQTDEQVQPNRSRHSFFNRFVRWRVDLDHAGWQSDLPKQLRQQQKPPIRWLQPH